MYHHQIHCCVPSHAQGINSIRHFLCVCSPFYFFSVTLSASACGHERLTIPEFSTVRSMNFDFVCEFFLLGRGMPGMCPLHYVAAWLVYRNWSVESDRFGVLVLAASDRRKISVFRVAFNVHSAVRSTQDFVFVSANFCSSRTCFAFKRMKTRKSGAKQC